MWPWHYSQFVLLLDLITFNDQTKLCLNTASDIQTPKHLGPLIMYLMKQDTDERVPSIGDVLKDAETIPGAMIHTYLRCSPPFSLHG